MLNIKGRFLYARLYCIVWSSLLVISDIFTAAIKPDFHSRFSLVTSDFFHMGHSQSGETNRTERKKISLALFGFEVKIFQQNLSDFCGHFTRMKKFSQNGRPTALSGLRENRPQYNLKTNYSMHTERRSVPVNCIIDNTHCIVLSFWRNTRKMWL